MDEETTVPIFTVIFFLTCFEFDLASVLDDADCMEEVAVVMMCVMRVFFSSLLFGWGDYD